MCDHGVVTERVRKANALSVKDGGEVISEYYVSPLDVTLGKIRVTTSAGWGATELTFIPHKARKKVNTP